MEKLRKMIQEKKAGSLSGVNENELEQYAKAPEDKGFNKFSKRISRHPDQVLRYDRGGTPLWITSLAGDNSVVHVPKCEYCNGERQFELQVSLDGIKLYQETKRLSYSDIKVRFEDFK